MSFIPGRIQIKDSGYDFEHMAYLLSPLVEGALQTPFGLVYNKKFQVSIMSKYKTRGWLGLQLDSVELVELNPTYKGHFGFEICRIRLKLKLV